MRNTWFEAETYIYYFVESLIISIFDRYLKQNKKKNQTGTSTQTSIQTFPGRK